MSDIGERRTDLDIARAVASFLVVLNHIPRYFDRFHLDHFDADLRTVIVTAVYYFHMPTFMFVAGCVLAMGRREVRTWGEYWRFARKKCYRLILPFIAVSLLTLVIKAVGGGLDWAHAKQALVSMAYAPRGGGAPHLWFLYVLMGILLLWPLLRRLVPDRWFTGLWVIMLVIAVLDLPWPMQKGWQPILGLKDIFWYLPIFTLGFLYEERWRARLRVTPLLIAAAAVVCLTTLVIDLSIAWPKNEFGWGTLHNAIKMPGWICGGLWLIWTSGLIAKSWNAASHFLSNAGLRSYDVYLLHVALVGNPLVLLIGRLKPDVVMTYVWFVVAILVTWAGALLIGAVIRLSSPLAFVLLGIPYPRGGERSSN